MQEKIQNAIQKLTSEINESILCGRKDGWVDYASGDEGLSANSYDVYDSFRPYYDYGFGAKIDFYIEDIYNSINEEHRIELQKNIDYANNEFWEQLKDKLRCRSLEKYLKKLNETEKHDLLQEYDYYVENILQEFHGKILTKVTYWKADNIFNKIKEDFVRINTWIRYEDRNIKVCFDKIYNVDDFLHLVDNEIDDLGDVIFKTLDEQPIITDIDKYLS